MIPRAHMPAFVALSAALHVALFGAASWRDAPGTELRVMAVEPVHVRLVAEAVAAGSDPFAEASASLSLLAADAGARPVVETRQASDPGDGAVAEGSTPFAEAAASLSLLAADAGARSVAGTRQASDPGDGAVAEGSDSFAEAAASLSLLAADAGARSVAATGQASDPGGADPAPAGALTSDELALRIHEAVQPHFHYPLLARRHGWEGEVRLMLRVESDGRFSAIRVLSSSGHRVLDRAAVEALDRLARLPDARGVPPPGMETELPVRYRLIDPA